MKYAHPIIHYRLSREQVREVDQRAISEFAMSGLVLMENAALGVCQAIEVVTTLCPVAVLCGKGNNAGDGYAIARHLESAGWPVHVFQFFDPKELVGDAEANWKILQKGGTASTVISQTTIENLLSLLSPYSVILDCMLGTGAQGSPRKPLADAIIAANACKAIRIAVDLPSGLDCDTGHIGSPCFLADHTCTFVAEKLGFAVPDARLYLGQTHIIGIGVPRKLLDETVQNLNDDTETSTSHGAVHPR